MASQKKPLRDWAYLGLIALQLYGMLALDLVAFYPRALWEPPSAPLHFLVALRARHVATLGDPYLAARPEPWFRLLLALEGLVQLPLAAYLVARLATTTRSSSGPVELAALVLGCLTAMGAATCCFDLWHMGPERLSERHRASLLYAVYLPFAVIPALMAVDMYLRLLPRVREPSAKAKSH